ncbi:ATPase AAA [Sphaerisporangium siamense]|uniref:DNA-binding SARP family transcriptional activator n=1 Tax=Sphaerisporangium siamense TaxID=795645 RepID=A0A7W7D560_9ACTN|nr:BTAD domain-containing putative transcriptional regulator [Sphaerisporangium siamense]MBB4700306.1 DNA-binding SARP family transcriptional activator [Sphaerisporangium siamense]GII87721.1 ATPase AAA [Sphaerisporangium siamense]
MVHLRVLGQFQAEVEGRPVELGAPLQRAVIARLVCAGGHVVSTDRFIDDLWQGQPPPKALAALQVYISNLRRVLEPDRAPRTPATVLVSAPPGYLLRLDPDHVDAWRFPKLVDAAVAALNGGSPASAVQVIDDALSLWRGPAFAEFADEEWAAPEAARLRELKIIAAECRAEAGLALGSHAEVVPELERQVAAHPLRENAVRLLALAYYRSGRQADALAALRRTRTTLADELGVDPGPALRALEADILAHSDALDVPRLTVPIRPAAPPAAPPSQMIGRTAELARLVSAAEQAGRGFRVAWLGGDPGAGKSTLADALLRRLDDDGWQVAVGRCPETLGGVPPAWAWSEVLRGLFAVHPPAPGVEARLTPLLREDSAQAGRFWLAQAVGDYLENVPGPLLLVLEDVHRADDATLQLLRHLAARLANTPVLVVLTHRSSEDGEDLVATRAALTVQTAENVALRGLGEDEVRRLLLERSGVAADPGTVRTVTERTGGNPLFVAETARLLATEGASAAHSLPPGVRDLIRRRIARLPATARTTLRNAAVMGRDADADVLIAVQDADEEAVLDGLEAGVVAGLLTEPSPGRVRFTHVLVRETLYEDIPRLRRVRLHAKVLTALERVRPGDLGALGYHALAAATPATAVEAARYARRAAAQASAVYAHKEAATLLENALGALDLGAEPADGTRLDLLCRLVSAQASAGDLVRAAVNRRRALEIARSLGDPAAIARAAVANDAPVIWISQADFGFDADLVESLRSRLPAATGELRCRLLAALAQELVGHDDEVTEAASAEAVEIARGVGDPRLLCLALNARYWVAFVPGHGDELEALGHELLETSARGGLLGYQTLGHYALCNVALGRNDWATAQRHAARAVEYSTNGQLGLALVAIAYLDALRLLLDGEFERAEAAYTVLGDRMDEAGSPNAAVFASMSKLAARLACGRAHESVAEFAAVRDRVPGAIDEFHVSALVAAGRLDEARSAWPAHRGPRRDIFLRINLALRAGNAMALGSREVAEECYRLLLPAREDMIGLHTSAITLGPAGLTLGRLAEFLDDPARAAEHYATAADVAGRIGSPHWREQALEALAAVRRRVRRVAGS